METKVITESPTVTSPKTRMDPMTGVMIGGMIADTLGQAKNESDINWQKASSKLDSHFYREPYDKGKVYNIGKYSSLNSEQVNAHNKFKTASNHLKAFRDEVDKTSAFNLSKIANMVHYKNTGHELSDAAKGTMKAMQYTLVPLVPSAIMKGHLKANLKNRAEDWDKQYKRYQSDLVRRANNVQK